MSACYKPCSGCSLGEAGGGSGTAVTGVQVRDGTLDPEGGGRVGISARI